ncbi:MAG TPA: hypothetical protein P5120_13620 [Spirochaetota bacterium]|nr:hypothetical protein [Spirochaetota bacterium]HPF06731.1 hypothetical protein [Spirochaetota bacterium]HPJ43313.1 hypothetical protein [Spirochaetota bacterium]HPR38648.1 hypothetical protein [Spirochaetota bacterium]HRX48552.1 hypothetical protein [Spirochaetota bacterium]
MKKFLAAMTVILFMAGCGKTGVIPEMKDFMGAFGSKDKMTEVINKYSAKPEIVPEAIQTCNLAKPNITKTEEKDGKIVYTAEALVEKCENSETAVGTIRIFEIGWENGKIVSFEWHGPKSGKVEY